MDEAIKNLIAQTGRSLAGDTFKAAMQNIHIPSLEERMEFSSAAQTITVIARQITEWEKTCPEGKHPVVNMRTPDGRSMDIERVRPEGFNVFIAEGLY